MITSRHHLSSLLLLLLSITSTLSLVVPPVDSNSGSTHSYLSPNDLTRLHQLNKQATSLVCHETNQRMSCYGGIPVGGATCKSICTCENGRISCPAYKYCDDSTMDIFCGGLCACNANTSARLRSSNDDRAGGQVMISGHRYQAPAAPRRHYEEDEEEDEDDDARARRRARRAVGVSSSGVGDVV
jgi:hypothetical protein